MYIDWKSKKKGNISEASTTFYRKEPYIYIDANPLTKVLGLHATIGFYNQKQKLKTTRKPSLRHLSILLRGRRGHGKFIASS
jgi:hypothetical protein